MAKQATIAWCVLGGLALLAGWWGLVPKIGTATEAEVRAHVAPGLLQPLHRPEGGVARFEALQDALDRLGNPRVRARQGPPLDPAHPVVKEVIEILRAGPIDRTEDIPAPRRYTHAAMQAIDSGRHSRFLNFANGINATALRSAGEGDWVAAARHMEASCLLLDRLFESDVRLQQRYGTMSIETALHRAMLSLAAREMPAAVAEQLSALLVKERHGPASLSQVLRGEMQYVVLPWIGYGPRLPYAAGTYEPLETAELLGARFLAMIRDAGLPAAQRSADISWQAQQRAQDSLTGMHWFMDPSPRRFPTSVPYLTWPAQRIRLNTTRNSIGRAEVVAYPAGNPIAAMQRSRTMQDQVATALAVVRFRHRAGRDPRDFMELVAAGLLRAVPMDHARDLPQDFDLQALFQWPTARGN